MFSQLKNKEFTAIFEKLQTLFLCLFAATLCLRKDLNQGMLIAALFFSLFLIRKALIRKNIVPVLLLTAVYLIAVISTLYSNDKKEALFVLEKQFTLFIVPVILGFSFRPSVTKVWSILRSFNASVFVICSYLLVLFYKAYQASKNEISFQEFLNLQIHHQFSAALDLHATYLSMYVCFCIAISLYAFFHENNFLKVILFLFISIYIISLVMLSSRIIILPFLMIAFFVLPFFIQRKQLVFYLLSLTVILFFAISYIGKLSAFKERYKTDTLRELNITEGENLFSKYGKIETDDATRAERWKCSIELITEKPILGYGTGDEKSMLAVKYKKYKLTNSLLSNFDAHNQYLAYTIKSGILGLLAFITLLGYGFVVAMRTRNYFYISFLLIIAVTSLTENILESNKGILFFALFNTLFVFSISGSIKDEIIEA